MSLVRLPPFLLLVSDYNTENEKMNIWDNIKGLYSMIKLVMIFELSFRTPSRNFLEDEVPNQVRDDAVVKNSVSRSSSQ